MLEACYPGLPRRDEAPLFVATLGASGYTFAGCTRDQQMESWLRMHVRAFEHFGGIPALTVPDGRTSQEIKRKSKTAVQVAQRWIVAALRHHRFFSLEELNMAIRELLTKLNNRPFRKRDGSRASVFAAIEKPALKPLPSEPFDLSEWSPARIEIDYHVNFDANLYSVQAPPSSPPPGTTPPHDNVRGSEYFE